MTEPARICNRCAEAYSSRLHTCAHPLHAAIDPACVYTAQDGAVSGDHMRCDVCGPIRLLLSEESA